MRENLDFILIAIAVIAWLAVMSFDNREPMSPEQVRSARLQNPEADFAKPVEARQ